MKVVADDKIPFLKGTLEPYADVVYLPGRQIDNDSLKDADALLIRTRTKCTEELLKGTKVKFIGTATIGFDHIDTQFCEKEHIKWTNAPGCNSSSVQQYIAAALLKIASEFRFSLKDKILGIVGVGNVGSKVERLAGALGMKTLLCDPPRAQKEGKGKFVDIGNILYESDIVTVHVPLNIVGENYTYLLFNDRSFKKMKKNTWFINSSRGEVVDTASLRNALSTGKLAGAVLDVWENEPDIDSELLNMSFIATPHIAGYSTDGKANGTAMIIDSLSEFYKLPLKSWYPDNIPGPEFPEIVINCKGKTLEEIIREAVLQTYDIIADDKKLRFLPSDFERYRGDYQVRREFHTYTLRLRNCQKECISSLENMGFNIIV